MLHVGTARPYDARIVALPVVVDHAAWTAYLFADSCQVGRDTAVQAVLPFVCEDDRFKVVQGLTRAQKAFVRRVSTACQTGRGPTHFAPTCAEDAYESVLAWDSYTCQVHDDRAGVPFGFAAPYPAGVRFVSAQTASSMVNDGFALYVKGRLPQPFLEPPPTVPDTRFLFSVNDETKPVSGAGRGRVAGVVPYAAYDSLDNQGLDTLCTDVCGEHAHPDAIQSCAVVLADPEEDDPTHAAQQA
jgi:hypothetical protein